LPKEPIVIEDRSRASLQREVTLLWVVVLLGLGLRALRPDAMAVEHFDEGVYASNLYCGHLDPPFAYPMRHLYAPPLFPALLEWAQILFGPPAAMWVNVLLGSLMVPAVWWTTRCWFGRAAAIAAALLAATSEYHIAFSRMALTDVPLSLFMLLGVFAGWKGIVTGRPLWIVTAGLLAGLAWSTKYNGWLTLAVTGSGTAAALLAPRVIRSLVPKLPLGNALAAKLQLGGSPDARRDRKSTNFKSQISDLRLGPAAIRWGLTAAIAGVIFWVFVLRDLAPLGGYAAVAKNHAGYYVGLGGWWSGFLRQAEAHDLLMGWPTCVGIAVAFLVAAACEAGRPTVVRWSRLILLAVAAMLLARLLTVSGLLAVLALAGFAAVLQQSTNREAPSFPTALAGWMLLAWFIGLVVSVPLYYPYSRLSLPWVVACWPLAGAAIAQFVHPLIASAIPSQSEIENQKSKIPAPVALASACIALAALTWLSGRSALPAGWPPAWQQRSLAAGIAKVMLIEIETAAARTATTSAGDIEAIVYVQGDPAMFYQLAALSRSRPIVVLPVADASGLQPNHATPTFLVTHATGAVVPALPRSARLVQSYEYQPSDMVLLDRMPASAIRDEGSRPVDVLRLDHLTDRH